MLDVRPLVNVPDSAMTTPSRVRTLLVVAGLCLVVGLGLFAWTAEIAFFEDTIASAAPDVTALSNDLPVAPVWGREQIRVIERRLLAGTGSDHDDPGILAEHGSVESVPAILAALKRNPADPSGGGTCCRAACLIALRQIAGSDQGTTDHGWEQWWRGYRRSHPARPNYRMQRSAGRGSSSWPLDAVAGGR